MKPKARPLTAGNELQDHRDDLLVHSYADTLYLIETRKPLDPIAIYRRLHTVLAGVRGVFRGEACLTREGATYLGVPYRQGD